MLHFLTLGLFENLAPDGQGKWDWETDGKWILDLQDPLNACYQNVFTANPPV